VERIIAPAEEIIEEEDEERLDEALSALREAKAKFKKGNVPEGVPSKIVRDWRDEISEGIMIIKIMKGFASFFE